jgi:hypothetical protein
MMACTAEREEDLGTERNLRLEDQDIWGELHAGTYFHGSQTYQKTFTIVA